MSQAPWLRRVARLPVRRNSTKWQACHSDHHGSKFPARLVLLICFLAESLTFLIKRIAISSHNASRLAQPTANLEQAEPWPLRRCMQVQSGSYRALNIAPLFGIMTIGRLAPLRTICRQGGLLVGSCFSFTTRASCLPRLLNVIETLRHTLRHTIRRLE
jgi:hypothetical protein